MKKEVPNEGKFVLGTIGVDSEFRWRPYDPPSWSLQN
jgi:hypothetical protein